MRVLAATCLLCRASALLAPSTTTRGVTTARQVSYLSTVEDDESKKKKMKEGDPNVDNVPSEPRAHALYTESVNAGPANYDGFIDGEGFDGGDGQVGVVGDGSNAMEVFDTSQAVQNRGKLMKLNSAIGGSESKKTQKVAWGTSTGYAEELEKGGMSQVDEYGEDKLRQRRQQLENWRNQGELRVQKDSQMRELATLQGKDYVPSRQGGYLDQFSAPQKTDTISAGEAVRPAVAGGNFVAGDKIDETFNFVCSMDKRDGATISVDNEYATYSEFKAGFTDDSAGEFTCDVSEGTFNRRGGVKTDFTFVFHPTTFQDNYEATFVIKTDDHTWTYKFDAKCV